MPKLSPGQLFDAPQLVLGQRGSFRRFRELLQLRFVVDIGQAAGHARIGQQPLQRRLAQRAIRANEKLQRLDFLQAVEQPGTRPVAAMIRRREDRLRRVFAFEHAAGMGDADQVARAGWKRVVGHRGFAFVHDLPSGMRLEQIMDVLQHMRAPALYAFDALVKPADGRPERRAVGPDFSLAHEVFQQRPNRFVLHLLHADVVQLKNIDAVGVQPLQRLFPPLRG